jgi:hypothetical protein
MQPHMLPLYSFVVVRLEPQGKQTASVVGIPEIYATAATREEAIAQVQAKLREWLASGQLAPVELQQDNPWIKYAGWAKDDPDYNVYLEELERLRQADLESTLREYDQECSSSSSTPIT